LKDIVLKINSGLSLYKSFNTFPLIMDRPSLRIIKNAEETGSLSKNCQRLAIILEDKLSNQNRLIGALIYPLCIVVFAFALILILLFFVFPKIIPLLQSSGAKLPLSTRVLIFSSVFLKNYWIAIFLGVGMIIILLRLFMFRIIFFIPIFSSLIRFFKLSVFSKEMSLFLESGYSVVEALDFCYVHENNPFYKDGLKKVIDDVKKGTRFSKTLEENPTIFGHDLPQFAHLGEESGGLSKSLLHVSALYDEDIKNIEKKVFALIEPVLMLFLGLIVGFVALSLITPIYSITSSINTTTQ
ncbi:MAG: type II secretion system F family protein, partial [Candidatus Paceibacterota bacterium]